ncbi:DUF695 domain-containing protein [Paraglaciecola sp.]|uniref:DUF695 domain-containing protein n=1 Tax=Paraglaciecola sp. TaxID=1920173 RepID=UPI0032972015
MASPQIAPSLSVRHQGLMMKLPDEHWVLVEGKSQGHPYFMMVNDGLKHFPGKSEYSYCLIAVIELDDMQGHRLPTNEEAEVLYKIEDILIDDLSQVTLPIQIGRETYFGEREILIYFPEIPNYKSIVDSISQKTNLLRPTHIEFHHDPSWKQATRYLGVQQNA